MPIGRTSSGRAGDAGRRIAWSLALAVGSLLLTSGPQARAESADSNGGAVAAALATEPVRAGGAAEGVPGDAAPRIERVATTTTEPQAPLRPHPTLAGPAASPPPSAAELDDPIARARRIIAESRERYRAEVRDYSCVFYKRELVGGRMTPQYVMQMKARARPMAVYMKFLKPDSRAGREAIYAVGQNRGKALVHDVGLGKLLAGTLALDPRSPRAMDDCRHPITSAGIGHMLDTIHERWAVELTPGESVIDIRPDVRVGDRPCLLIVSTHTERRPDFMFHRVKVYIDRELGLPIRFEAYDWPPAPGREPPMVEEYTFSRLELNVGLTDRDFDPSNPLYSFGRF